MISNIAYIESPLQAFNLVEYLDTNNLVLDLLIINKRTEISPQNYEQISYLLNFINYKSLMTIDVEVRLGKLLSISRSLISVSKFINFSDSVKLISGEYRSRIFWMLTSKFSKRDVILLDDGTATLRIQRSGKITARSFIKNVFYKIFGLVNNEREKITFFSVYDIEDNVSKYDKVIRHHYQSYKLKLQGLPQELNKVFIIGSPLYEAGVTVVDDIQLTLKMINKIKKDRKGSELVYIPHRRERDEKINALKDNVNICRLSYPFELYPLVAGENVVSVAGFYSSLYDNLINIYDDKVKITAYVLDDGIITPKWIDFVKSVYENYRKYDNKNIALTHLN
ncbi:hypothetical protein AB4J97_04275 [Serratia fonticola]|uniref:hypothetical protein n=1 Tax=Serratia fonticola TaxID=47917 RepID=UPI0034C67CA8